jgi:hypothetical protein
MTHHDALEALEQRAIRDVEAIRPNSSSRCASDICILRLVSGYVWTNERTKRGRMGDALVLHDSDPARPLTVAWAQPNIVGVGKPDFEGAVRS